MEPPPKPGKEKAEAPPAVEVQPGDERFPDAQSSSYTTPSNSTVTTSSPRAPTPLASETETIATSEPKSSPPAAALNIVHERKRSRRVVRFSGDLDVDERKYRMTYYRGAVDFKPYSVYSLPVRP